MRSWSGCPSRSPPAGSSGGESARRPRTPWPERLRRCKRVAGSLRRLTCPPPSIPGLLAPLGRQVDRPRLVPLRPPRAGAPWARNGVTDAVRRGRHFLQIPGPTNVPDRVLRAMDLPTIDHRGPEFQALGQEVLIGCRLVFQTEGPVVIFPGSGTGAWEAALVNTLSPGDRVLMFETGQFATLWRAMAENFGLVVDFVPGDWRQGVDSNVVEAKLTEDARHAIKAVMCVHNETSTGVTSQMGEVRRAIDAARHPALL